MESHLIKGSKEAVAAFTQGKRVIYRENYGSSVLAAVYGQLSGAERELAGHQGITIDGLPLQKFFAYLIEGGEPLE
ncbi:hypothetical protein D3C75_1321680 [compost metagenome]